MRSNRKIFIQILFSFIILIFTEAASAQNLDNDNPSKNLSIKLQQKILLSDEQTKRVEVILADYISSAGKTVQTAADKKIEALLDDKQKAKYGIVKADLWNEVNKAAASKH